jgi:cytochrome c biogenesis protein CcdA/thiol-disulfide isomerase/thioredoxin
MELILISLLAGALTVLSPCVLPLLPIIIGGSIQEKSLKRPIIITLSLALSVILFTLLLKVGTTFANISPEVLQYLSGGLVIFLGIITVFPRTWEAVNIKLGLQKNSDQLLEKSAKKEGILGPILTGVSLGPVFASCSPTYALIIATVLPASFSSGIVNLISYSIGLGSLMFLVAIFGQRAVKKLRWASNPDSFFRRGLGVLFIIVGILVYTGYSRNLQVYLARFDFLRTAQLEQSVLKRSDLVSNDKISQKYKAAEFTGNDAWINSEPLKLSGLKGKVVLVDFWTYSCINCIRTIPSLNALYDKYKKDGLVIIGMHSPEFQFEKQKVNVEKAVKDYSIKYPVALDNNFDTWKAFKNNFWPAKYFIDKDGFVRYTHFGEGNELENEKVIRSLLVESGANLDDKAITTNEASKVKKGQTAETYLGYSRADRTKFLNDRESIHDESYLYKDKQVTKNGEWALSGSWKVNEQDITSTDSNAVLKINFSAKEVYLVIQSDIETQAKVFINGSTIQNEPAGIDVKDGIVTLNGSRLYRLVNLSEFKENQELKITFDKGVKLNAFTFGS